MKYLLDTHCFIWLNGRPDRLSENVEHLLQSNQYEFYLSIASVWEMQIKYQLGKLPLPLPLVTLVEENLKVNAIKLLPLSREYIYKLNELPLHHRDPFDRIIIAQAIVEGMSVVSIDSCFMDYPVITFW